MISHRLFLCRRCHVFVLQIGQLWELNFSMTFKAIFHFKIKRKWVKKNFKRRLKSYKKSYTPFLKIIVALRKGWGRISLQQSFRFRRHRAVWIFFSYSWWWFNFYRTIIWRIIISLPETIKTIKYIVNKLYLHRYVQANYIYKNTKCITLLERAHPDPDNLSLK